MNYNTPSLKSRTKIPILLVGDIIVFYLSLALTLFFRYGQVTIDSHLFNVHLTAFSVGLLLWILVFYVGGLYEKIVLKSMNILAKRLFVLSIIGGVLIILLLYFIPSFGITPKTNLFIFLGIFFIFDFFFRYSFNILLRARAGVWKNRILLLGNSQGAQEINDYIKENSQLGYEIGFWLKDGFSADNKTPEEFQNFLASQAITSIVIPSHLTHDPLALRLLYHNFLAGIEVVSLPKFYQKLFDKVSLSELDDAWLLENLPKVVRSRQILNYVVEGVLALLLLIVTLPITLISAILTKLTSSGPVFYRQKRVGRNKKTFWVYKFRSMYNSTDKNPDAEAGSPTWSKNGDARITPFGKLLRATHIDELPQLINILMDQMSFVGPRPERPEFTKKLEKEIPYYELRYLLKPGITGWAQINYPYGSSVKDAYEKLQYEIYYLQNQSLLLDLGIVFKTIKKFFVNEHK